MSRVRDVLKNKNKVERSRRARRKSEMISLRDKSIFKAKLYDELQYIETILSDTNIDAVKIIVPDRFLNMFSTAIYSEDLAGYEVTQVENEPKQFYIRRRFISF